MNKVVVLVVGAAVVAAIASSGCIYEGDCGAVDGEFLAVYEHVGGSCSIVQPARYHFDSHSTKSTIYETDVGGAVITDVNRKGCMLAVTKTRLDIENNSRWQMIGDLDVDTSTRLTGVMTRYEWTGDGLMTCQGSYSTTMTKVLPEVQDATE